MSLLTTAPVLADHAPARAVKTFAPVSARPAGGLSLTYLGHELKRPFNRQALLINVALPAVLYLALHRTGSSHTAPPHGNFAMWMMIGIAVYGSATASTSTAVGIAIEKSSGWMRTMRLMPISSVGYVLSKVASAMLSAVLPVVVVGLLGWGTGAEGNLRVWILGLLTAWGGSAVFAAFGLGIGLTLRAEIVTSIPGLTTTALAFIGNLFLPLSGRVLQVGRWTPMFGVSDIARRALTDGCSLSGVPSSLTFVLLDVGGWFVLFVLLAARAYTKSSGRA